MMPIALGAMSTKLLANRVVLRFGYRPGIDDEHAVAPVR